jgi:transposase InsO family protein
LPVNKKRVHRLLKENNLLVRADSRLLAKRTSNTCKPRPERVNLWWGIDMTKVMTCDGWVYVVLVLDWKEQKGGRTLMRRAVECAALAGSVK